MAQADHAHTTSRRSFLRLVPTAAAAVVAPTAVLAGPVMNLQEEYDYHLAELARCFRALYPACDRFEPVVSYHQR